MIPRLKNFKDAVWGYYKTHKRSLAWRNTKDPYKILVSEVMLQQTQVERVKKFYEEFLRAFPNTKTLAEAPLSEVLKLWKGLGYNRRAVNLKRAAEEVEKNHKGKFPKDYASLLKLPGIGQSTAGAIMNFAYNTPTPFIETNIRSIYLYSFFKNKDGVHDKEILELVSKTQDAENPREWYYALYDYGTHLKKTVGNQNSRSRHFKKQSSFKGSNRELRSLILSRLLEKKKVTPEQLVKALQRDKEAIVKNLTAFEKEGVIRSEGKFYKIV